MSLFADEGSMIRMEQVVEMTGLSRSMIYKLIADKKFPEGVTLVGRTVGWRRGVVSQWIRNRAKGGNGANLPLIYMAGRMGTPIDNKRPGAENTCWRMFDVSKDAQGNEIEAWDSHINSLIMPPVTQFFYGTEIAFQYSGPWKAMGQYHGYIHGVTTFDQPDPAFNGALQGITRADVFVAYIDDLKAFGTLVEIGYARALNKRIIVITPKSMDEEEDELQKNLWFAIRAADRHIILNGYLADNSIDLWTEAHVKLADEIANWYPATAIYKKAVTYDD